MANTPPGDTGEEARTATQRPRRSSRIICAVRRRQMGQIPIPSAAETRLESDWHHRYPRNWMLGRRTHSDRPVGRGLLQVSLSSLLQGAMPGMRVKGPVRYERESQDYRTDDLEKGDSSSDCPGHTAVQYKLSAVRCIQGTGKAKQSMAGMAGMLLLF
jgi:hypothetical protein